MSCDNDKVLIKVELSFKKEAETENDDTYSKVRPIRCDFCGSLYIPIKEGDVDGTCNSCRRYQRTI